jgi:prevent-host-death family protein
VAKTVNIHEAKTHFSRLVEEAAAGREIIIARAGKAVARLVPLAEKPAPKRFGLLKGQFRVPTDFNAPLDPQSIRDFEGT